VTHSTFSAARVAVPGDRVWPASGFRRAKATIIGWNGHVPAPLHRFPAIAGDARLKSAAAG
jgi:hypothetical protein